MDVLSKLSMNGQSICIGVVSFILGGVTGGFLLSNADNSDSKNSGQSANTAPLGTKQPRFGQDWGEREVNQRPTQKPRPLRTDESMISVPISLLKSLSIAKSNHTMGQAILDDNDPVEAALGLTSVEKDRIQNDWQRASEKVREIEITALTTKDLEDGSVVLSLPDLSKERKDIAKQFMSSVTQTLGAERGEAFYATKQVDSRFAADAGERSVTVKIESAGEGEWSYQMSLQDASGSRVWVGESIPLELRHLADAAGILPTIEEAVGTAPEE
ncbi:MAG: hypothetical protein V4727_02275 [Verrucomicrobiota bacterium]